MTALKRIFRALVVTIAVLVGGGGAAMAGPLPVLPDPGTPHVGGGVVPEPELITQGVSGAVAALIAVAAAALAVVLTLLVARITAHRHQGSDTSQWSRA